jgi:hypothetical protein
LEPDEDGYIAPIIRTEWNAASAAAWGFADRTAIETMLAEPPPAPPVTEQTMLTEPTLEQFNQDDNLDVEPITDPTILEDDTVITGESTPEEILVIVDEPVVTEEVTVAVNEPVAAEETVVEEESA